jgi:hypothetical protein
MIIKYINISLLQMDETVMSDTVCFSATLHNLGQFCKISSSLEHPSWSVKTRTDNQLLYWMVSFQHGVRLVTIAQDRQLYIQIDLPKTFFSSFQVFASIDGEHDSESWMIFSLLFSDLSSITRLVSLLVEKKDHGSSNSEITEPFMCFIATEHSLNMNVQGLKCLDMTFTMKRIETVPIPVDLLSSRSKIAEISTNRSSSTRETILGSWTLNIGLFRYFLCQVLENMHKLGGDRLCWETNCMNADMQWTCSSTTHGKFKLDLVAPRVHSDGFRFVHSFQISLERLCIWLSLEWIQATIRLLSLLLAKIKAPHSAVCQLHYYESGCLALSRFIRWDASADIADADLDPHDRMIFIQILCATIYPEDVNYHLDQ